MPFVMLCGLASSGKTYYTNLLKEYFQNNLKKTVKVISDTDFIKEKNLVYLGKFSKYKKNYICGKIMKLYVNRCFKRERA